MSLLKTSGIQHPSVATQSITINGTTGAVTFPNGGPATLTGTETLTNKTLASPTFTGQVTGLELAFSQSIVFEGATADANELTLSAGEPTADRTVTLPNASTTLVGTDTTDTLSNKTISATSNTLTGVINNTLTTTTGDLIYASAANTPARLGIGSTGNVLTVSGGVPVWSAPAGGGKILQVVTATTSSSVSIASTSYNDTGLSASITPSSTSSRILVLTTQHSGSFNSPDSGSFTIGYKLNRSINNAAYTVALDPGPSNNELEGIGTGGQFWRTLLSMSFVDSPATTSSVTYKTTGRTNNTANNQSINFQVSGSTSVMTLLEIGA